MLTILSWMLCCFPATDGVADEKQTDANSEAAPASADSESTEDTPEEPRYLLRYRFADGQQLRYRSEQESTVDAQASGARKTDVSKVEQQRLFTVNDVTEDGVAHLAMQFEHVRMQIQSDDKPPVFFDTTMKPSEIPRMFQQAAHRLKGNAARYKLTSTGEVAADDDAADAESTDEQTDAATFLIPLPSEAVAVGDTWKSESTVKVRVTAEISRDVNILRTFRLKGVDDGIATISFNSSVQSKTPSVTVRAQLIQATPRGIVTFDVERGVMLSREIRFDETVVGALGPRTVLASWGETKECLVESPQPAQTSAR